MAYLTGPNFISIQTGDLDAARRFYSEVVGLKPTAQSPPGAVVFDTGPVSFAVRTPIAELKNMDALGEGVSLWFGCDDADALYAQLVEHGAPIVFPPKDGPFGRYFAFRDPFGYTITANTTG